MKQLHEQKSRQGPFGIQTLIHTAKGVYSIQTGG